MKLEPLALRGFGFEDAQTALGECYLQLAGLDTNASSVPTRHTIFKVTDFQSGLVDRKNSARRSFQGASGDDCVYAAGLGPDEDKIEGAKWAHLYLKNPSKLNLGAPIDAVVSIDQIKASMDNESWLIGKERARVWGHFMTMRRRNCRNRRKKRNKKGSPNGSLLPPSPSHSVLPCRFKQLKKSPISLVAAFGAQKPILRK